MVRRHKRIFFTMNKFNGKGSVPSELVNICGIKTNICRFMNGLDWQEILDKSSNEIENYRKALDQIQEAEIAVMKFQKRLIQRLDNNIFEPESESLNHDSEIRKKYGILQLEDILYTNNVDLSSNNLPNEKCDAVSNSSTVLKLATYGGTHLTLKNRMHYEVRERKGSLKTEYVNLIIIAEPKSLRFRNFKLKKTYKKTVLLKNVSSNLAKFQLGERPKNSKFSVFLEFMGNQKGIAPGMYAKLIVVFRCDVYEESEEEIVVKVEGGKSITIPVHAFRDPPILEGISTLYHSCFRSDSLITPSTSSINTTLMELEIWTGDEQVLQKIESYESSSVMESSECELSSNEKISTAYFECGKCFIGELVIVPTTMRNVGGNGRFFIMSEVDWFSMNIEDVSNNNMVIIPPFACFPAYFILRSNEEIIFHSYFFPTTYGMQVDKFFMISDNCSIHPIEIIGDGIMFEEKFILFHETLKSEFEYEVCEDEFAKYCVELSNIRYDGRMENFIEIFNTSGVKLHYRWEQREVRVENKEMSWTNLSLDDINIYPRVGIFEPYSKTRFHISVKTANLESDQYWTILQLCIEDIPLASIYKKTNLHVEYSQIKRRMCQVTVDIFIFDIEIRMKNLLFDSLGSTEKIFNVDESVQLDAGAYLVTSSISNKQNLQSESSVCCIEKKCSICNTSITTIKAIIEYQNLKRNETAHELIKTTLKTAIMLPSRDLYVGNKETFILILRNISNRHMIFKWGEVFGLDKDKLKVSIYPEEGLMCPQHIEIIQVFCEPLESGIISSFFIPCYSERIEDSVILEIKCFVKSLNCSFYFSLKNVKTWLPDEELICVNWNRNSDTTSSNIKIVKCRDILPMENEQVSEVSEVSGLCERDFDQDSLEEMTIKSFSNESLFNSLSRAVVPFHKREFISVKEPTIQFLKLSLKIAEKRTFLIENNTPLTCNFSISLKNFYSVENDDRKINDDSWDQMKRFDSGIVLIIKPSNGKLGPFEIKIIEIFTYSDTWGDYEDEININVDGLPTFRVPVQVQVEGLPVFYPACRNLIRKTPILRFMRHDALLSSRTLAIENTSILPLIINWHCFLIKEDPFLKPDPFKLLLDIFKPFSAFEFSEKPDCKYDKSIERLLNTAIERYDSNPSLKELNRFDSLTLTPSYDDIKRLSDFDSQMSSSGINNNESYECICESLEKIKAIKVEDIEEYYNIEKCQLKPKKIEIKLSLIPNYGELDHKTFSIQPEELFIPSREKRFVTVQFNRHAPIECRSKINYCAVGFIRIAPEHRSQDKCFQRKDGCSLPPTIIDLEIVNKRPYLTLLSLKSQKVFKCFSNNFKRRSKEIITIKRKLLLKNENQEALDVNFKTSEPFEISCTITKYGPRRSTTLRMQPGESIEVEIACSVKRNWVQEIIKENERHKDWLKTVTESLLITYHDGVIQEIELFLQIYLPLLKLSSYFLKFERTLIGSTKELFVKIENFAVWKQAFQIKRKNKMEDFSFFPINGLLSSSNTNAGRTLEISIIFEPTKEKTSRETLVIISGILGYEIKLEIQGEGILEKI